VVARTSPLGMQKEAESRQSVRRATEGLHGGVGRELKSLGAVAEAGQTKKHMVGLPRVSTSLSDIMRTDDAVPVDFLKREAGRISAAPWVSFFARCHVYVSSQYQIFCISWPCGLENCDMQPLQPHHARAGCLMTE
jgi:hypothetical protein